MKESSQNDFKEAVHCFMTAVNKWHVESMYQIGIVSI